MNTILVIIDGAPHNTASVDKVISLADLAIIPVKPTSLDLHAVQDTIQKVKRSGKPFTFVLNECRARSIEVEQATNFLRRLRRWRSRNASAIALPIPVPWHRVWRSANSNRRARLRRKSRSCIAGLNQNQQAQEEESSMSTKTGKSLLDQAINRIVERRTPPAPKKAAPVEEKAAAYQE